MKTRILLTVGLITIFVSSAIAQQKVGWVTAYWAGWAKTSPKDVAWKSYTHLCIFSATPDGSGGCKLDMGWNNARVKAAVAEGHRNHVKVLLCVGGGGVGRNFVRCTADVSTRAAFIKNIIGLMKKYEFDGVDMDWEELQGKNAEYVALHKELRAELDKVTPRPLLTAAIANWMFNRTTAEIHPYMDQLNNMSYWTRAVKNGKADATDIAKDMQGLVDKGVPKAKLGVGIGLDYEEHRPEVDCDPQACIAKCRFAIDKGYGGVMIWAIEKDAKKFGGKQPCHEAISEFTPGAVSSFPDKAESLRALPAGQALHDVRLGALRSLDVSEFPMRPVTEAGAWPARRDEIRQRILVAAGLHPMPERCPLNAIVYGKVLRDDYTVERVIFESFPGHYVTGSLYRPKDLATGRRAAVLCPHGHWQGGRFQDHGLDEVRRQIAAGAEKFEVGGRHIIQARCVQLARMGCVAFAYDMEGNADSIQLPHAAGPRPEQPSRSRSGGGGYLFFSPQAELHGQTMFGLQTWNSIRAVDFIESLPDVDDGRIGVTGESGGGTQSMILGAIDDRIAACFPAVMVSTAMQGGCTCENAAYLRINQGNIDIAAAVAPRPLGITAADDWTKELRTKGSPELAALYKLLGHGENFEAHFHLEFQHNYNAVNRLHMYSFMNRHLRLGLSEPIVERDYIPLDTAREATVWTESHPKPSGEHVGEAHERMMTAEWTRATEAALHKLDGNGRRHAIAEGLATIVGRLAEQVGPVKWAVTKKFEREDFRVTVGVLTMVNHGEQLPATIVEPKHDWNRQVVVWLADNGKESLFGSDGQPVAAVAELVRKGYQVAAIDMFAQGEFQGYDGSVAKSGRLVGGGAGSDARKNAACFTFGYNPPLPVERVHDIMSLVEFIRRGVGERRAEKIALVACGKQAGGVGLLARCVLGDRVGIAAIDMQGFDFASVDRFDDPMFLPGILRYGGLDALWQFSDPLGTVKIHGTDDVGRVLAAASQ